MGTRNLTCVFHEGKYKVAKYGQWDGYLEGLGKGLLMFLKTDFEREKFLKGLATTRSLSEEEVKRCYIEAGALPESTLVDMEVSDKFKKAHFSLDRDCSGAQLLKGIQDGQVTELFPNLEFAADSLFCEWCYVLDLDKNTFEIYQGFNKDPLDPSERFAFLSYKCEKNSSGETYHPVRLLKSYKLNRLPKLENFLKLKMPKRRKTTLA
jgi:hypothetical protein